MPIVQILHLSDLRGCGATPTPAPVTDAPWSAWLDEVVQAATIDLLCVTGDLSRGGQRDELASLSPLLRRTCGRLRITPDRLFVIPGDHDVDARRAHDARDHVDALFTREPIAVAAWMTGDGPPPTDADPAWKPAVLARQEAFWSWLREDLGQVALPTAHAFCYHASLPIPGADTAVHVFGLDSSWLTREPGASEPGTLGPSQVSQLTHASRAAGPGPRVALVHHSLEALRDGAHAEAQIAAAVDLVLCGHAEPPRLRALPASQTRQLAAGPLSPLVGSPSCQLIQIEVDRGGTILGFAVRGWSWSSATQRWVGEDVGLPGAVRGRAYWGGTRPPPSQSSGRPWDLATLLTRLFASAEELRMWLCWRVPEIHPDLPSGTASLRALASDAAEVLARVGAVDTTLLDALADASPAYGPAIMALWRPPLPSRSPAPTVQVKHDEPTRRESPELAIGDVLPGGRYQLLGLLGRGGFATVWRARDLILERDVAIKILHPQDSQEPARRDRFLRGARAMKRLTHRAVVRVFDPHGGDLPRPYFVMELIEGKNLHEAVTEGAQLGAREIVAIVCEVGEALAQAHALEMVHRDIKPANILLDREGKPHLTDFDLVRARDTTGGTRTGGMGTFVYAAPEQVQSAGEADARADVYGLGMTALFMLHGSDPPYMDILSNPGIILARIPVAESLKKIVLRAIAKKPSDRFTTVQELCSALTLAQSRVKRAPSQPRASRPWLLLAVAFGLVAFVMMASWWDTRVPTTVQQAPGARVVVAERAPVVAPVVVHDPVPPAERVAVEGETGELAASSGDAEPGPDTAPTVPPPPARVNPTKVSKRSKDSDESGPAAPAPLATKAAVVILSEAEAEAMLVEHVMTFGIACCREYQQKADEPVMGDCGWPVDVTASLRDDRLMLKIGHAYDDMYLKSCLEKKARGFADIQLTGARVDGVFENLRF